MLAKAEFETAEPPCLISLVVDVKKSHHFNYSFEFSRPAFCCRTREIPCLLGCRCREFLQTDSEPIRNPVSACHDRQTRDQLVSPSLLAGRLLNSGIPESGIPCRLGGPMLPCVSVSEVGCRSREKLTSNSKVTGSSRSGCHV